tara:strand:- start:570 stop:1745 length:1176 start_codon:yes stop_codon:yes gene_type:complete
VTNATNILHVDMDAFYASVEQRDNPSLRGKPVVVGGNKRGVVAAASYEARKFGIRSAMPMKEAMRKCPNLVQINTRMSDYAAVSKQIFSIFLEFTPIIEKLSLDEAFLDVSNSIRLFGDEINIATKIKDSIFQQTGLTASIGIAPNKLVAKIASDLDKPDGIFFISNHNMQEVLDPLPVQVIPGIGPETLARLQRIKVFTVGDLRQTSKGHLEPIFGRFTKQAQEKAAGIDKRSVRPNRERKSISAEVTFNSDVFDRPIMYRELLKLAEQTSSRLRAEQLVAGTVHIKVRKADFSTSTRQCSLLPPNNLTKSVYTAALNLLDKWLTTYPDTELRLLGVGCSQLAPDIQTDLFSTDILANKANLEQTVDKIRARFGHTSLSRARSIDSEEIM